MNSDNHSLSSYFAPPSTAQIQLLKVTLGDEQQARAAWKKWAQQNDLRRTDNASQFMSPQVYLRLKALDWSGDDFETLKTFFRLAWSRNQLASRTLVEINRALTYAEIDSVAIKGVPLSQYFYPEPHVRFMNDVDIVVQERDLSKAIERLLEEGWELKEPRPANSIIPYYKALALSHKTWLELDLHWRPFTYGTSREAEHQFWQRCDTRQLLGSDIKVPDASDMLILSCMHSRKRDPQANGRWVLDVMAILDNAANSIDWDALPSRVQQVGLVMPVRDALYWVVTHFSATVPQKTLDALYSISVDDTDKRRYFELIREDCDDRGVLETLQHHYWRFGTEQAARGEPKRFGKLIQYALSYYKRRWNLSSNLQMPVWMIKQMGANLVRSCKKVIGAH